MENHPTEKSVLILKSTHQPGYNKRLIGPIDRALINRKLWFATVFLTMFFIMVWREFSDQSFIFSLDGHNKSETFPKNNSTITNLPKTEFKIRSMHNNSKVFKKSGCNHRDYGNGATVCVCSETLGCDNLVLNISPVKGIVTLYRTTKSGTRFEREEFEFLNFKSQIKVVPNVTVLLNHTKKYQKILGFGGAFTDATGINLVSLPTQLQDRLIRDYFAEDGLEYRLGRIPIGGTDFSTRPYTYDDGHPDDFELRHFELQPEDLKYKIPYIKRAQNVSSNQLKFLASSWSPPAWMKINNAITPGALMGAPGGAYYELYAEYLVRFLREYKRNNIEFWGLTVQNEPQLPGYANIGNFSQQISLLFKAEEERDFLKLHLGPLLAHSGYQDIQVLVYDDNYCMLNVSSLSCVSHDFALDYVSTVLGDSGAANFASGISFHWYLNTFGNVSLMLDQFAEKYPDKFVLATEACIILQEGGTSLGNWTNFDSYATDIINDLNHHVSGWIDWNMALDLGGGPNHINNVADAPVIVNASAAEYYKQPMFYALEHFTKFLEPNCVRIEHQLISNDQMNSDNFFVTAFERPDDNSTVMIVLNKNNYTVTLFVNDPDRGLASVVIEQNSLQSFVWY